MPTIRPNAFRVKRFRELKADLWTRRDRLLVGIGIAKVQHVAQIRLAHARILDPQLRVPNTQAGFAGLWAHLDRRRVEAGDMMMADGQGVISSILYGPDRRTRITADTRQAIFAVTSRPTSF
jgi:hypothetical protein